jgi:hypothetical protein
MKYRVLSVILAFAAATALEACSESDSTSNSSAGGTSSAPGATGGSSNSSAGGSTSSATGGKSSTSTGAGTCKSEKDVTASASAVAACKAYCVADDPCNSKTTIADCEEYNQCSTMDTGPAGCAEASKKYWDCMRAQDNVCDIQNCCDTQGKAMQTICNP